MTSFGICILPTDEIPLPPLIAIATETRGFDMLFFAENSHVPIVHRKNSYHSPEMVQPFARMYDSITALASCAAVTSSLKLGTGVCLLTERDPIITAKSIATLDHLSKGRVIFGVAGGWIKEAMENHGTPFKERWRVVRDHTLAIKALWKNEPAEYRGEYIDFAPADSYPKPYQKGGPPILIGSNSSKVPSRVADYADGWMPIHERYEGDPLRDLKNACDEAGRDYATMTTYLFGAPMDLDLIADYDERGCDGFIFLVPPEKYSNLEKELDHLQQFCEKFKNT